MYSINWSDGKAKWEIRFTDFTLARGYLYQVFHEATLSDGVGNVIGGVRLAEEHEKKRRNHKWFRWIDGDKPAIPAIRVSEPPAALGILEELEKI